MIVCFITDEIINVFRIIYDFNDNHLQNYMVSESLTQIKKCIIYFVDVLTERTIKKKNSM